jgi:hypothetical protein
MKKLLLLFVLSFYSNLFCAMQQSVAQGMLDDQLAEVPSLKDIIMDDLNNAENALTTFKGLLGNIKTAFQNSSYFDSINVAIVKEGEGGIYLDYGYIDHGDLLKPFTGFKTKVDFNKVPEWLQVAFVNTLAGMGFDSIINISPQNEFLIKLILLLNDVSKKIATPRQALTELMFLFYRLAQVEKIDSFESFFKSESNLIYNVISSAKVNGKSLDLILDDYWKNYKEIVTYDFKIEESNPTIWKKEYLIESNDWATILKVASAIGLRTSVEYYQARQEFINKQPQKAQELNEKIINATSKKERFDARKEFLQAMPGYEKIKEDTIKRTRGFLIRIKGIRDYWNKFIKKIQPTIEPFFDSIGLPFDLIVRSFSDLENFDDIDDMYVDTDIIFDEDSTYIDFYDEFDVTEF